MRVVEVEREREKCLLGMIDNQRRKSERNYVHETKMRAEGFERDKHVVVLGLFIGRKGDTKQGR